MKPDLSELSRIGKHKRAITLIQHQVIVFARVKVGRFDMGFAGHPEVNAQPVTARSLKEHLFTTSVGSQQFSTGQIFAKRVSVGSTEDVFPRMRLNLDDRVAESGVP